MSGAITPAYLLAFAQGHILTCVETSARYHAAALAAPTNGRARALAIGICDEMDRLDWARILSRLCIKIGAADEDTAITDAWFNASLTMKQQLKEVWQAARRGDAETTGQPVGDIATEEPQS